VQVDPMKPTLKAPGPLRLKLKYDGSLSNFAFKSDLRRYTKEPHNPIKQDVQKKTGELRDYLHGDMLFNYGFMPQTWEDPALVSEETGYKAEAYTRPLLSST